MNKARLLRKIDFSQHLMRFSFILAAAYIVILGWLAVNRMSYPYALEWIEEGMVVQVQRILQGQRVYAAPGLEFVPFIYTPFYFYLSAGVAALTGGSFFALRLVSVAATLVSFALIFLIVKDETRNWWAAFIAAGLFAGTYPITGAWLDIARVDSLFLALWLAFIYLVRNHSSAGTAVLAGAISALAFLTKQIAFFVWLPLIAFLVLRRPKYAAIVAASAALIVAVITLILNQTSDGWYTYYTLELLQQQTRWSVLALVLFFTRDTLGHFSPAILFILFYFIRMFETNREKFWSWAVFFTSAFLGTFFSRVKEGGFDNTLIPLTAMIAILFGLGFHEGVAALERLPENARGKARFLIQFACAAQLLVLAYNPFAWLPTQADREAGDALVVQLSQMEGNVFLPEHGVLAGMAGQEVYAHHAAIMDVVRGTGPNRGKEVLLKELEGAVSSQFFDVIVSDVPWIYCCDTFDEFYRDTGEVFPNHQDFYPASGWQIRPAHIYLPRGIR